MFGKKRLAKIVVTLKHGTTEIYGESRSRPETVEEISLLPGQSFHSHIGYDEIREHGQRVKTFVWKAGFTVECEYFYQ